MSAKLTGKRLRELSGDWEELTALSDEEVHRRALADPDAQPTTAEMWKNARVVMPVPKQLTSFRVDPDVLDWFKRDGKGYQTRINAVLRSYVDAQRKSPKAARR
ncbi:MAG: BrnA antitoxin family protein [Micropepsaceae bacterium]